MFEKPFPQFLLKYQLKPLISLNYINLSTTPHNPKVTRSSFTTVTPKTLRIAKKIVALLYNSKVRLKKYIMKHKNNFKNIFFLVIKMVNPSRLSYLYILETHHLASHKASLIIRKNNNTSIAIIK